MHRVLWVSVLAAAGCGRLQFDATPARDASSGMTSGDGSTDDGSVDSGASFVDAPVGVKSWSVFSPGAGATDWYTALAYGANDLWVGGIGGAVSHYDGTQWTSVASMLGGDANTLWGVNANDLWAGGPACAVARWNGSAFSSSALTGCSNKSIFGIGGAAATDVWIAGVGGTLVHWLGVSFANLQQASNIDLWAVAAPTTTEAYIVGTKGTILHWTGTFANENVANNIIVSSIWYDGVSTYWVVGTGGVIYKKVGAGTWTSVASPTSTFLYAVMGVAPDDIWAAGDFGTLIHYDGTSWTSVSGAPNVTLRAFARVGNTLRLVGDGGTILTYQ